MAFTLPRTARAGSAYVTGDVFAAVGNSTVIEYTPSGAVVQTLNDGSGTAFTTGMAFDGAGNLYVTNFGAGNVSKFDNSGNLVSTAFITGVGVTFPESIALNGGNFFIGGPQTPVIDQFNSTGGFTKTFSVLGGTGTGGTDWIDFQNANTILYTGEGTEIRSFNMATNTQNPDLTTGLPSAAFALKVIPSGPDAGDVLVANSLNALLLSPGGAILRTYSLPGNGGLDFSLNLDPNGTDFWTGDLATGTIWEVNVATGAIDHQFSTCGSECLAGVAVFGEHVIGQTPEPATLSLLGLGLAGLLVKRRQKVRLGLQSFLFRVNPK
jgi:hypothetical protein